MSKSLIKNNLPERSPIQSLLAVSLCATMAAFGCTTDRTVGNGDPVVTPGSRTSPTSGTSAGTESEALPPPMMSSFSNGSVVVRSDERPSAEAAAAIMAQHQPRVRVLGPASADSGGRPYASDRMTLAQQGGAGYSVNASGTGQPFVGEDAAAADFFATSGVVVGTDGSTSVAVPTVAGSTGTTTTVNTGPTSNAGTNVTNAATPVVAPSGTAVTPTSNAISTPSGFASVRTLSPTAASVINPPASVAITGPPAVATRNAARTNTTSTPTTVSSPSTTTNVGVANPVRVQNANGRIIVTNSGANRQQ